MPVKVTSKVVAYGQRLNLETAVARLNKLDTASQWGYGWLAELPMKSMYGHKRAASLPCPHWRPFSEFSFTFRVPRYFLALARKVNDLRRFS